MSEAARICGEIDRFCRLQCAYGPIEAECPDCLLFEYRTLDSREQERLRSEGWEL